MWLVWIGAASAAPVDADEVVRLALERDPSVVAALGEVERAEGTVSGSRGLRYNPQVQVRSAIDGSTWEAIVQQPISLSGEGLSAARSARKSLVAATADVDRARLVAAADARRLYAEVVTAAAAEARSAGALELASRLRDGAEARLREGDATELDARLARLDLAAALEADLLARRAATALRAELAALTGLPTGTELADDPLAAVPLGVLQAGERSDVVASEGRVEAAASAVRRERAASLPPVGIGVFGEGTDAGPSIGPLVQIDVPLWSWNPEGRAAARATLTEAEAERDALALRVTAESASAAALHAAASDAAERLPESASDDAREALASVERAWTEGQIGLAELGALRLRILDGERAWYAARAEAAAARLDAMLAVGDPALLPPERIVP